MHPFSILDLSEGVGYPIRLVCTLHVSFYVHCVQIYFEAKVGVKVTERLYDYVDPIRGNYMSQLATETGRNPK